MNVETSIWLDSAIHTGDFWTGQSDGSMNTIFMRSRPDLGPFSSQLLPSSRRAARHEEQNLFTAVNTTRDWRALGEIGGERILSEIGEHSVRSMSTG